MKKIALTIGLIVSVTMFSQNSIFQIEELYHGSKYREMKRLQKRFDKAFIYKEFFYYDGWYMVLEESDREEYYKRFGIKFRCIPKRKLKKIELFMVFYDEGEFNDEEIYF